jgi:hypothetical protein
LATPLSSAYIGSPGLVMACPLGSYVRQAGARPCLQAAGTFKRQNGLCPLSDYFEQVGKGDGRPAHICQVKPCSGRVPPATGTRQPRWSGFPAGHQP